MLPYDKIAVPASRLSLKHSATMSFFGFDAVLPERRGPGQSGAAEEDIAVYTWGTEDYGDLGGQLVEGGDEANDETFGDMPISRSTCLRAFQPC
jgi:hypothetical protein